MKKLVIKKIVLFVETTDNIGEAGGQVLFDSDIKISSANNIGISEDQQQLLMYEPIKVDYLGKKIADEELIFFTPNDITVAPEIKNREAIRGRASSLEEIRLIEKYLDMKCDGECFQTFDISESNKLLFMMMCQVIHHTDGKIHVENYVQKFTIKHNVVYEYDEDQYFDDFDQDVSELTDLLK